MSRDKLNTGISAEMPTDYDVIPAASWHRHLFNGDYVTREEALGALGGAVSAWQRSSRRLGLRAWLGFPDVGPDTYGLDIRVEINAAIKKALRLRSKQ